MKIVHFRLLFSLALVISVLASWAVGTSRVEVIHGTDQFEFTYRVKLPEIWRRPHAARPLGGLSPISSRPTSNLVSWPMRRPG